MFACLSLLLAVTSNLQVPPTPPVPARTHRRHVRAEVPLAALSAQVETAAATLAMAQPDFAMVSAQAPALALAMAQPAFAMASAQAPALAMSAEAMQGPLYALSAAPMAMNAPMAMSGDLAELGGQLAGLSQLSGLATLADVGKLDAGDVLDVWWPRDDGTLQADVADSLYRAARRALNSHQYDSAAVLFRTIRDRYPRSTYVDNSYYWQAFALYRTGSDDALRAARDALHMQSIKYPKATTRRDAEVLMRRVQSALAQSGDADAAAALTAEAESIAPTAPAIAATPAAPAVPAIAQPARAPRSRGRDESCDDDDDIRIAALNGLLQMDADRAVPILKTVLARRDSNSTCLRRKAVFLVSQKRSSETSAILLNTVRTDPDQEVREQAVFWLSQVPGDETVAALDSVLRDPKTDPEIQEKAIFALSQHHSSRAGAILRAYAERKDAPQDNREKAIFWLGQAHGDENAQFLRDLYGKLDNEDLKDKVLFSVSQMGGPENYRFLMDVALNQKEDIDLRKKALFWAGQNRTVDIADLVQLYDRVSDREMKEQLIFVYSQRREDGALDKLFAIGKTDPDRELRKKAIFWIGQSRSPRAAQYLQELINQ
ncbi:MAG TPA: HEAT repeat domain-containing protein [Gemmatimonadales bacterium]|nr:HEAT repeat domain-containing protein [Gemmatimonadales bacterium]